MTVENTRASQVFSDWLRAERKARQPFELIWRLAYLDEIMTTTEATPIVTDLAAAQAVSQLHNVAFLDCLQVIPHKQQALKEPAQVTLTWLTRVTETAHSHLFSNIGLLMEIVLDKQSGRGVEQWDQPTISTAIKLSELSNDQLLSLAAVLAARLDGQPEPIVAANTHYHLAGQREDVNHPRQ
ncbi:hypothetical protein [Furfurilactobacillus siliginis]|uniref:Uncharacterized protein n=1 Tax=Furfurilactobacillus siliginis TaxID=348151 RepID=A0A0R2L270_9LACO|nr:hypothetical protein [Furfurilactobacillus siliginis]KRN95730.1 hypothetical protein IV55_GL001831 [Furfurilactobacillus siliginis]GEK28008.1 hypothetical protein LSI01_03190 [Furfurilactobacillus siliginis]